MLIQEAVYNHLISHGGTGDLVGTSVYHTARRPQDPTSPWIIFGIEASAPVHPFIARPSAADATLRVMCVADDTPEASALLADQVRDALDTFTGAMGGGPTVLSCLLREQSDDEDVDLGLSVTSQEYQIIYEL
jgi:hypothetical protein